jgi:hypothetical protein
MERVEVADHGDRARRSLNVPMLLEQKSSRAPSALAGHLEENWKKVPLYTAVH